MIWPLIQIVQNKKLINLEALTGGQVQQQGAGYPTAAIVTQFRALSRLRFQNQKGPSTLSRGVLHE